MKIPDDEMQGQDIYAMCEPGLYGSTIVHVYGRSMHLESQVPAIAESPLADRVWNAVLNGEWNIKRLMPQGS